jgi:peptidoglycan/LPS O-acetylase OafA/YrhL
MAKRYRTDIDGLRGVAVALVVIFHAYPLSVPGGFVGVDVFFVVSGYLITGLVLEAQAAGTFDIANFYARRARRILPALGVVIAATLLIGWIVLFPAPFRRLGLDAFAGALFIPNLVDWSEAGYFNAVSASKPLIHLWSLGIEEQFYLVWPALLVVLRRWRAQRTAILAGISALSLAYSSFAAFHDPTAAFYSPLSRLWELGVGGVLASRNIDVRYPEMTSLTGLALIVAAAFTMSDASVFPGALATIPVLGAAMVVAGRSRILTSGPLVETGLISYALYLWHWPLLSFATTLDFHTELARAVVVAMSVILAWLTTRYVEYPIRFGGLRLHGAAISAGATVAIALCSVLVFRSDGFPERYPPVIRRIVATKEYDPRTLGRFGRCWIDPDASFSAYKPECRDGDILVWGDSYAGLLAVGFPAPVAEFVRSGCLPLLSAAGDQCAQGNQAIVAEILRLRPKRVIVFARWLLHVSNWEAKPTLRENLKNTLHQLRGGVDDVVLIGTAPAWWPTLPDLVYRYWSKSGELPDRLGMASQDMRDADRAMADIARQEDVDFVSILDALCDADGCLTHTADSRAELLAFDYGHLTNPGAAYVVQTLGLSRFDRATVSAGLTH